MSLQQPSESHVTIRTAARLIRIQEKKLRDLVVMYGVKYINATYVDTFNAHKDRFSVRRPVRKFLLDDLRKIVDDYRAKKEQK